MKIDLSKIDAQIRKLEEIRKLASDPEALALLETLVVGSPNGNGNSNGASASHAVEAESPKPTGLASLKPGSQVASIAQAALQQEEPFTGYQLAAWMQDRGFHFNTAKPGLTVTDVIRNTLIKKGVVRVFKKGFGNEPMHFVRVLQEQ